jgi:hypothetical protein
VATAELLEYAETPDRFSTVAGAAERYADDRVCILQGPTWASVSGVRVDDPEALLGEVRSRVPAETDPVWSIGPSAQPPNLYERLLALGLHRPRDGADLLHALALTEPPPEGPPGVEAHEVKTFDDHVAASELRWEAFESPEHRRAVERGRLRESFEESHRAGIPLTFLATLDGRPAATAMSIPSSRGVFLIGGATAPWARGRGLYRALVRARWDDAVRRGTPTLVTHAKADTSLPILLRAGFVEVCRIRRLEDLR